MKRNQVVLLYGLPASGKYTVAKKIQEQCGGVLLDNHYFYDLFIGMTEGTDEKWHDYIHRVSAVRNAFLDVVRHFYPTKKYMRYIFTSVLLRGEKLPGQLRKFARDIDADFIPIELAVSNDALVNRCETPERERRKKIHNKEKYRKMLQEWGGNAFHSNHVNRLVIDSTDLSPEDTFKQIKKHLKKFD